MVSPFGRGILHIKYTIHVYIPSYSYEELYLHNMPGSYFVVGPGSIHLQTSLLIYQAFFALERDSVRHCRKAKVTFRRGSFSRDQGQSECSLLCRYSVFCPINDLNFTLQLFDSELLAAVRAKQWRRGATDTSHYKPHYQFIPHPVTSYERTKHMIEKIQ